MLEISLQFYISSSYVKGNQLLMGTKDCVFLRMYEELYRLHYDRAQWYFNGGHLPAYALLDKYPGIAYPTEEGVHQGM